MVDETIILDKNGTTPIFFLGETRELRKTNKRIANKITYFIKKDLQIEEGISDPDTYILESEKLFEEMKTLIKQIITPITDEELEDLNMADIEGIQDEIAHRKYRARGLTEEEINDLDAANKAIKMAQVKAVAENAGGLAEDFQKQVNTERAMNTGKQKGSGGSKGKSSKKKTTNTMP